MPRGHRRSDIEILQDQIVEAQKRKDRNMQAVAKEKKEITRLEKEINRKMADEIAVACRTKGIPLKTVLEWVLSQPDDEAPAPEVKTAAAPKKNTGGRKPAAKKAQPKKAAPKKAAPRKKAPPKTEAPVEPVATEPAGE